MANVAAGTPVSFGQGSIIDGSIEINPDWVFVVVPGEGDAGGDFESELSRYVRYSDVYAYQNMGGAATPRIQQGIPPEESVIESLKGAWAADASWTSLAVEGPAAVALDGVATLLIQDSQRRVELDAPPAWVARSGSPWRGHAGVVMLVEVESIELELRGSRAEFHGGSFDCVADCPDNPGRAHLQTPFGPANRTDFAALGDIDGTWWARNAVALIGFQNADLTAHGDARLALLQGDLCHEHECEALAGNSVRANGTFLFGSLQAQGGRLHADMDAAFHALAIDERSVPLAPLSVLVATGAVLGVGLVLAWLISRELLTQPLENPVRVKIHDTLESHAGLSFRDLQRVLDIGNGHLMYHLSILRGAGILRSENINGLKVFRTHTTSPHEARLRATLARPKMGELHMFLAAFAGTPRIEVVRAIAQRFGWPESTSRHRLKRLCSIDAVQIEDDRLTWNPPP